MTEDRALQKKQPKPSIYEDDTDWAEWSGTIRPTDDGDVTVEIEFDDERETGPEGS